MGHRSFGAVSSVQYIAREDSTGSTGPNELPSAYRRAYVVRRALMYLLWCVCCGVFCWLLVSKCTGLLGLTSLSGR